MLLWLAYVVYVGKCWFDQVLVDIDDDNAAADDDNYDDVEVYLLIRGTECDQKILSKKESRGQVSVCLCGCVCQYVCLLLL